MKENKNTGALEPAVSRYRSEVGGIDDVQLFGATDKVRFSAEEAVAWLRQPNVIGGYVVELFRPNRKFGIGTADGSINRLRTSLQGLGGGLLIRPFLPSRQTTQFGQPSLTLSIQLFVEERRQIELPFLADGRALEMSETGLAEGMRGVGVDTGLAQHTELLTVLANQALMRSVELPPLLETDPDGGTARRSATTVETPVERVDHPVVAVVDGGVASNPAIGFWKVGDAGLVPAADRDESHGTFIAGLICAGSKLNPALSEVLEPAGCKVYDLDLFPRIELRNSYYPDIEDLFDTLDEKVKVAKRDFGVRVFNLSFRLGTRSGRLAYLLTADRLDRMARGRTLRAAGVKHHFTRFYRPQTNGKAERFIQTALRKWAYARTYQNSMERLQQLDPWLHAYNFHRPHASLNYNTPVSRSGLDRNNLLTLHTYCIIC